MLSVKVRSTYRSFFGALSELSGSRIVIYTYRVSPPGYYYVLAMSPDPRVGGYVDRIVRRDRLLRRSKLLRVEHLAVDGVSVIHGLKSVCEFHRLVEDSQVSLLIPYTFNRGVREYSVIGGRENLEKYLASVKSYYGEDLVEYEWREGEEVHELAARAVRSPILAMLLDKLTEHELRVLRAAYYGGYFEYPKERRQSDIGEELSISKVTISIHLRKALKKILSEILGAWSTTN